MTDQATTDRRGPRGAGPADLGATSLPAWAVAGASVLTPSDLDGTFYLLVGVGEHAPTVLATWRGVLEGRARTRTISATDPSTARDLLAATLARARVGTRVWATGPVGACLTLWAAAAAAGLEDDEFHAEPCGDGPIEVACVHCGTVVVTGRGPGAVADCPGCARGLLIMAHLSRRTGRFLGLLADVGNADTAAATGFETIR